MGSLKEFIDPSYKVSDNPNSMFRALKFKEITPELSGNYSCKVDTDDEVKWLTKQVIVYCKFNYCVKIDFKIVKIVSITLKTKF